MDFSEKILIYITAVLIALSTAAVFFVLLRRRILRKIVVRYNKVSEKKNAKIKRVNQELRLLSLAAAKTANSVVILDTQENCLYVNDSFKTVYGCSWDEFKSLYGDKFFEALKKANPENNFYISQAQELKATQSFEYFHIDKSNRKIWVQMTINPVFDSDKQLCNWIITETDITRLKKADQEVLLQTQALTQAYMNLSERQSQIEFQKRQLMSINERLEIGYKQINRQNMTIKESLRYARSIQNSILPTDEEMSEFLDFFVIYMPKDIVSGDFYVFEKLDGGGFIIAVADCTGHGIPGAFMSLIGYNILNHIIKNQHVTDPKEILELLNLKLAAVLRQDADQNFDGMDICICLFSGKTAEGYSVTYSGTRNIIYLFKNSDGKINKIKGSQRQIGFGYEFVKSYQFVNHFFNLLSGDFVIMLTDGFTDQCNSRRRRYGTDRLSEFLEENHSLTMHRLGNKMVENLKEFMQGAEQRDDITVLGFSPK